MERKNGWWRCTECGAELPPAPKTRDGVGLVDCPGCGVTYRFDYWALNRWPGDTASTGLVPRLWRRGAAHKAGLEVDNDDEWPY